jgi:hypothetical protein
MKDNVQKTICMVAELLRATWKAEDSEKIYLK